MNKQTTNADDGWKNTGTRPTLPEVYRSLNIPKNGSWFRKVLAFLGPGYLVAVGYMDPGNWATDLAGGSMFGYTLLSVIFISNLMAILLQALAVKFGIVTGQDLAQACRDRYSKPVAFGLWILAELMIVATDLAEVLGAAIALNLLFGIPLFLGVLITVFDVLLILLLQNKGVRLIEFIVIGLISVIGGCFAAELLLSKPDMNEVLGGFLPTSELLTNPEMLYIAMGILGATVMPHNLYLHTSIVQTRNFEPTKQGMREAIRFATLDSTIALLFAFFINSAILILASSTFHQAGHTDVADLADAYHLLTPLLGTTLASILFGVALLASGQNSTLTGTLCGQIIMEGFLNIRLKPWLRRLITRSVAVVPAIIVTAVWGEKGTTELLVLSQVILSMQLPFAVVPLVKFTSDKTIMGSFANPLWLKILAWLVTVLIVGLNLYLLFSTFVQR